MSKYIDADALIVELEKDEERFDKEAEDCRKNSRNYTDCYMQAMSSRADGIRDAIVEVYDAPSIDIEPKCGEWIDISEWYAPRQKCSICETIVVGYGSNFCPNCGARMIRKTNTTAEEKPTPIRDYMVHGKREGE